MEIGDFTCLLATIHPCTWVLGATRIIPDSYGIRINQITEGKLCPSVPGIKPQEFPPANVFFVSREAYQVWLWAMPHRQRFEPSGAQHNLSEATLQEKKTTNAPEKNLPSGNLLQFAIEHGPVEIVSFPIKNGGSFHRFL